MYVPGRCTPTTPNQRPSSPVTSAFRVPVGVGSPHFPLLCFGLCGSPAEPVACPSPARKRRVSPGGPGSPSLPFSSLAQTLCRTAQSHAGCSSVPMGRNFRGEQCRVRNSRCALRECTAACMQQHALFSSSKTLPKSHVEPHWQLRGLLQPAQTSASPWSSRR